MRLIASLSLIFKACVIILLVTISTCYAANKVTLVEVSWPDPETCDECLTLQFGVLEMRLPFSMVGKMTIIDVGFSTVSITPPSEPDKNSISFLIQEPDKLTKLFKKLGFFDEHNIKDNRDFFDLIGTPPDRSKSLSSMRKAMGIDKAIRYTKMSKGPFNVYRIQANYPTEQKVYIVIDGYEEVYLFAGAVTNRFYHKILSNLKLSP